MPFEVELMESMEVRTLVVSSTHHNLEHVVEFLEAFAQDHGWEEDLRDRVLLCGSEVVTNAMNHGNHFDPSKDVTIHLRNSGERVELEVEDQGEGFERTELADPLAEENLFRDHGRGVMIIEALSDRFRYELGGRRVCLSFERKKGAAD